PATDRVGAGVERSRVGPLVGARSGEQVTRPATDRVGAGVEMGGAGPLVGARLGGLANFSLWSLRGRAGQLIPVALAFLLLVGAVQTIGSLHDIASTQTQQKIAQSWRTPYDLLIRSQSAVSPLERSAGWIDPQSALESFGGISSQQAASIRSLPHVALIAPFASIGWQTIAVRVPIELPTRGVYRVSATWIGPGTAPIADDPVLRYVDVTDLTHLTTESSLHSVIVERLVAKDDVTPVVFS